MTEKRIARIFEDVGGYYVCDEGEPDTRGPAYPTKAQALAAAADDWYGPAYTHAVGSGTYWHGVRAIPARFTRGAR